MLLYPHRKGDKLPEITWSDKRTAVTVAFPDQVDSISFKADDKGRTTVSVNRDGRELGRL